jgi:hypothetical protein
MTAKIHVWLRCGRLHQRPGVPKRIGQCCYVALAYTASGDDGKPTAGLVVDSPAAAGSYLPLGTSSPGDGTAAPTPTHAQQNLNNTHQPHQLQWNNDWLMSHGVPHARSAVDRRNGRSPIWNEHLEISTQQLRGGRLTLAVRDETLFEDQHYATRERPLRRGHPEVGSVTIDADALVHGRLYEPAAAAAAALSKRGSNSSSSSSSNTNNNISNDSNSENNSSNSNYNSSNNIRGNNNDDQGRHLRLKKHFAGCDEWFCAVDVYDAKGVATATVWLRMQVRIRRSSTPAAARQQQHASNSSSSTSSSSRAHKPTLR